MPLREREPPVPPTSPSGAPVLEDPDAFLARLEARDRTASGSLPIHDAAALDALAAGCARGGGAHELALGEGLELLARTGGDLRLGYSCLGDLARERLGLAPWQARRLRRNASALATRPLLRAAVLSGDVSMRKAEVVLAVAVGEDEPCWVERARAATVRRLEALVARPEQADEDWHRIRLALSRTQAEIVDGALAVAKVVLGPTAPLWKRLWALAAEYLSTHPSEPLVPAGTRRETPPPAAERTGLADLGVARDAREASPGVAREDPYELVERLSRLVSDRAAADERLGRACLLVKRRGVARQLGWSCFEEWCLERLGLAPSTVYQRMALERRMAAMPELRAALRSRRLSYEQARLVARVATPVDVCARIEDAAGKTCIALVRDLEEEARLQMCDAGKLQAAFPDEAGALLLEAIRAAQLDAGGRRTAGEALVEIALHFVETWGPEVLRLLKGADPVILRDEGLCRIPGCSRPAAHVHHLWARSTGGPLEDWNELSLCLPHHLLGVHRGNVLVTGRAPHGLTFVLGEREVARSSPTPSPPPARRRW